ncbi:MAG: response regulator [Arcobacteraceae bacterium]|nr:response regulator [Arcobacteraceae bacterium]
MDLNLQHLKTITVLYVEDEESVRNIISQTFERLFKKVYLAVDGQDGLNIFKEHQNEIEVVISDINMPNKNGMEMASDILAITQVPIIITTALDDKEYLLKSIELDINKYITKPIKTKELILDISKIVEISRKAKHIKLATISLATKSKNVNNEKKELEKKVNRIYKELKLLRVLSDHYISIIYTDKNAVITDVSTKFCNLYAYKKDELIGQKITEIQDETHNNEIQKYMLEAIHNRTSITTIHNFETKYGKALKCNMTLNPHFGTDGYIDGYTFYLDLLP